MRYRCMGGHVNLPTNSTCFLRETFGGPMASVIKLSVGSTLVDRLGDYSRDLKAYVEKGLLGGKEATVSES